MELPELEPQEPDENWDKLSLEQMLQLVAGVMPPEDSPKVIAICLIAAALETVNVEIKTTSVIVHDRGLTSWDDYKMNFSVNGKELTLEVKDRD
jgi:hypothetical protein